MRLLTTLTLIAICLTAIGQTCPAKNDSWFRVDTLIANFASDRKMDDGENTLNSYSWDIHTEIKYTYSTGKVVTIQNSGPRGGRGFTDATGIRFGYRVYCTRVVNEADTPLELTITFPADSFPLPSPDSYMKVFLLPDTMIHVKEASPDYDASLRSSYEAVVHTLLFSLMQLFTLKADGIIDEILQDFNQLTSDTVEYLRLVHGFSTWTIGH